MGRRGDLYRQESRVDKACLEDHRHHPELDDAAIEIKLARRSYVEPYGVFVR